MDLYSTINSFTSNFVYPSTENISETSAQLISDFPPTEDPVYIIGRKYSSLHELSEIRQDVKTRIWCTYRRNFFPIGDSGFTSDSGWGCMLRTGQMILAQALCNIQLGRDWQWNYTNANKLKHCYDVDVVNVEYEKYCKYRQILKMFSDVKTAPYSIHQIALMGACEGKNVGEWFGPNTIAQVLKKLSHFDKSNDVYIHVAMDNIVFIDDIKLFCKSKKPLHLTCGKSAMNCDRSTQDFEDSESFWRPLILFIPLRLGLSTINSVYFSALKRTFAFQQSLGILGGRPNHALYFIGCCGDDLIYLDPHITQPSVNLDDNISQLIDSCTINNTSDDSVNSIEMDDVSYHCERASRMSISCLDPSISLCFLCKTEADFDQWANVTLRKLIQDEEQPMFEIMKERPKSWPNLNEELQGNCSNHNNTHNGNDMDCAHFTTLETDEEYEIIE